jgi:hypothetical protein
MNWGLGRWEWMERAVSGLESDEVLSSSEARDLNCKQVP